jgi:hypothetical protein
VSASANSAAQLVKLGEAEALGMLDDHHGCVGYVDTDFDDGGGDEDIDFSALKATHDDFFFVGVEAAMEQSDAEAGERAGAEFLMHFDGGLEAGFGGGAGLELCVWEELRRFAFSGRLFGWRRRGDPCVGIWIVGEVELGLVVL